MRTSLPHAWREATTFNERPPGAEVDMLVLHYTGMVTGEASIDRLCDPDIAVSCHYLVDLEGRIVQMVEEQWRAYQAGVSLWRGVEDNNGRSIGIEIQNKGHDWGYHAFPEVQMAAVEALSLDILSRHPIPQRNVVGHSDIAPGRKIDPGEFFDWRRLGRAGIGVWVEPAPIEPGQYLQLGDTGEPAEALQTMFAVYGYGIEPNGRFDERTRDVVYAFQQHWRQERCDGVADVSTIKTLRALIDAIPEDER
ncbi:MAG: N-acetylmuramoyl-L-alanine amidase [Pseudomonadota bacterium]